MGSEALVSVLMVNYNHEDTIAKTIKSVLDQTYTHFQFIIIDDGSTDKSCDIIESFDDQRIELYKRKENEHICIATNYGFTKVKGEYLARIDSDDIWYPDKLMRQIQFMKACPDCNISFTWCDLINEEDHIINDLERARLHILEASTLEQKEWLRKFYFEGNCLPHSTVLLKTDVMRKVGGFRLAYRQLHDFDYWIRIAKHYKIYVLQERLVAMRRFMNEEKRNINASAVTEENETRVFNEFMDIRAHFFDDISEELFVEGFRDNFRCRDSLTKQELKCEKAFLLCIPHKGWNGIAPVGLEQLAILLEDDNMRKLLKEKYCFSAKALYEMTNQHIYYDSLIQNQLLEIERKRFQMEMERNQFLRDIENCQNLIMQYANSTSWKITKPLRILGNLARKKDK